MFFISIFIQNIVHFPLKPIKQTHDIISNLIFYNISNKKIMDMWMNLCSAELRGEENHMTDYILSALFNNNSTCPI